MKTHRERAAAVSQQLAVEGYTDGYGLGEMAATIARETFPTELVEAARNLFPPEGKYLPFEALVSRMGDLRSALAAYEETP